MPRILIVEDDHAIAHALGILFEDEGYSVRVVQDGADALSMLEQESVDVVLADIHMPVVDGLALLKDLRERVNAPPVVLMSAGFPSVNAGVPIIAKPFDPDELLGAIKRILR